MQTPRPPTCEKLADGLRRVIAPNPSPMTHWGTNTYILGEGQVAVIDPGPDSPAHLRAIQDALAPGETITHIFVTHSHVDHSTLVPMLKQTCGAPVFAFGDSAAGQSAVMRDLRAGGLAGGGEGVDHDFTPDETLTDQCEVAGAGWSLRALWTPGHMSNHMCFQSGDMIFTGDHVMGWASSLVSPPDGDLTDFMAATRRLRDLDAALFLPGHGPTVSEPRQRCDWLLEHRISRERDILKALAAGPLSADEIARQVYTEVAPELLGAATRNVFAHLIDLVQRGRVCTEGTLAAQARFHRCRPDAPRIGENAI